MKQLTWNPVTKDWEMLSPREARVLKLGLPVSAAEALSLEDIVMLEGPESCVRHAFRPANKHKLCIPHLVAFFKSFKVKNGRDFKVWTEVFGGTLNLDALENKLEVAAMHKELLIEAAKYSRFIKA